MKKTIIFSLMLCFTAVLQAQKNQLTIRGKVTNMESPLFNAEVRSEKSGKTVKTDMQGKYQLETSEGDLVTFSYPGLSDMEIVVEDVSSVLNIKLNTAVNVLDEVVVEKTRIKSQSQLRMEYNSNKNLINTAFGILDKEITNFSVRILDKSQFLFGGIDLASAIQYRAAGIRVDRSIDFYKPVIYLRGSALGMFPAIYDVDGLILTEFPDFINIENVERIAILSGLGLGTKYGGQANGGIIVINTKGANTFREPLTGGPYDRAMLRNNVYEGNALSKEQLSASMPTYLAELYASGSEDEALELYKDQSQKYRSSPYYFLDVFGYFAARWKNTAFADQIIEDHWYLFKENPVGMKALAYLYQTLGETEKAHELYKEIFILRPNYAQSYRDLALSYVDVGDYRKSAAIYARYDYLISEGFITAEDKEFTPLMEREFSNLLELHRKELIGTEAKKGPSLNSNFEGTRLVFEWNDSEAEFELQFVNPENKYYNWEHSLLADPDRIREEKIKGYSCEEYLIDGSLSGTWQVNLKYLGNKSLTPAFLKATIYFNFGTKSQRKVVKVFKLQLKNVNQELFKLQNSSSLVSN
ncbi:MAG: carboxypeptidase-like regulatory domain-containing protein [Muriicola sp.]|nr:carboxypeptidase-like regulatory domain-containing protein [Muriicola sp.]